MLHLCQIRRFEFTVVTERRKNINIRYQNGHVTYANLILMWWQKQITGTFLSFNFQFFATWDKGGAKELAVLLWLWYYKQWNKRVSSTLPSDSSTAPDMIRVCHHKLTHVGAYCVLGLRVEGRDDEADLLVVRLVSGLDEVLANEVLQFVTLLRLRLCEDQIVNNCRQSSITSPILPHFFVITLGQGTHTP